MSPHFCWTAPGPCASPGRFAVVEDRHIHRRASLFVERDSCRLNIRACLSQLREMMAHAIKLLHVEFQIRDS